MSDDKVEKTNEEWRASLSAEKYAVTREGGTERAFTGKLYQHKGSGTYRCACCDHELFSSDTKYESGSGWPSFYRPKANDGVRLLEDRTHGMVRTEVRCGKCDAHLGHVFEDGPAPTGQRYCINSLSLTFEDESGERIEG